MESPSLRRRMHDQACNHLVLCVWLFAGIVGTAVATLIASVH